MSDFELTQDLTFEQIKHLVTEQQQTLRDSATEAFRSYFGRLGGETANNIYQLILGEIEKPLLEAVMRYTRGNQSRAAILLGLSRGTLRKKLKIYGFLK